jgi:outer membrane autotransporter protein
LAIKGDNYWQVFAGLDFAKFSLSGFRNFDLTSTSFLAGIAKKYTGDHGKLLTGVCLEGGCGRFDLGDVALDPAHLFDEIVTGKGELRHFGLGLMARQTFGNNFRIEASVRAGVMENKFRLTVHDSDWQYGSYNFRTPYMAAHLGLAYSFETGSRSSLEFSARGCWPRLKGKTVYIHPSELSKKDFISFSATDSWRIRAGLRYTKTSPNDTSWYIGGYYDHEFDQKFSAVTANDNFRLDTPTLFGGAGIFERGHYSPPHGQQVLLSGVRLPGLCRHD